MLGISILSIAIAIGGNCKTLRTALTSIALHARSWRYNGGFCPDACRTGICDSSKPRFCNWLNIMYWSSELSDSGLIFPFPMLFIMLHYFKSLTINQGKKLT